MKGLPLPLQILQGADKDDVLQLMVVKVARPERHDEVPQADQCGFHISKYAHDHMTAQNCHGCLTAGLKRKERNQGLQKPGRFLLANVSALCSWSLTQ